MANGGDNANAANDRVVIDLHDGPVTLDLDTLDIEVNGVLEFEVAGRIENLDDDVLATFSGHTLTPAEIHFITTGDID